MPASDTLVGVSVVPSSRSSPALVVVPDEPPPRADDDQDRPRRPRRRAPRRRAGRDASGPRAQHARAAGLAGSVETHRRSRRLGSARGAALRAGSSTRTISPAGRPGWRRWSQELRARSALVAAGGGERAVERHRGARQAARPGADRPAGRPGHGVPRAERARRLGGLRRPGAVRRDRDRDRRRRGPRVRDRRERRDREGRLVLPAHGEEAPARAGGRRAEPPAVPLPRRLGRRVPAAAGRGVPRPRPLRPHLLQPGADVGEGDPADRGRDGLVHGRAAPTCRR